MPFRLFYIKKDGDDKSVKINRHHHIKGTILNYSFKYKLLCIYIEYNDIVLHDFDD